MSTTTTPPAAAAGEQLVSVALERHHAPHVAGHFFSGLGSELEAAVNVSSRAELDGFLALIADHSAKLEQVGWGEPEAGVTLTLPRGEMKKLGNDLIQSGSDMVLHGYTPKEMTYVEARRLFSHEIAAGLTILEQLEATR